MLQDFDNEDSLQLKYKQTHKNVKPLHYTDRNLGNGNQNSSHRITQIAPKSPSYSNSYTNRKQQQKNRRTKSKTPVKNQTINMNKTIAKNSYLQKHNIRKNKNKTSPYQYQPMNFQLLNTPQYFYQGQFVERSKNGQGIMLTRKGLFIAGKWRRSFLQGRAFVQFPFGAIGSLNFKSGKLNGWGLVLYQQRVLVCTLYFQDKIEGQRIIFDSSEELWVSSKYTMEKDLSKPSLAKITHVQKGKINILPSFVDSQDLQFFLQQFLEDYCFSLCGFVQISMMHISSDITFIGYLDYQKFPRDSAERVKEKPQKIRDSSLGVIISTTQSYVGIFQETGVLDGYGRIIYPNGDVYHGQLKNGLFQGFGYFYQTDGNITLIGQFDANEFTNIFQENRGYVAIDVEPSFKNQRFAQETEIQHTRASNSQKWKNLKFSDGQDFIGFYTSYIHGDKITKTTSKIKNIKSQQVSGNATARTVLDKNITVQIYQNSAYAFGIPELSEFIENYYFCFYVQKNKNQLNQLSNAQNRQFERQAYQSLQVKDLNQAKLYRQNTQNFKADNKNSKTPKIQPINQRKKKQKKQLWLNDDAKGVSMGGSDKQQIYERELEESLMPQDSLNFNFETNKKVKKEEKCSLTGKYQKYSNSQKIGLDDDDEQLPGFEKTYSLRKKSIMQKQRQRNFRKQVNNKQYETKNFNSITLKQNIMNQEMQTFDKHLPSQNKKTEFMMFKKTQYKEKEKQIESKSLQIGQITFRENQSSINKKEVQRRLRERQGKQNPKRMEIKNTNKITSLDYSNFAEVVEKASHKSSVSNLSSKVDGMLKRAKSKRKRIFD